MAIWPRGLLREACPSWASGESKVRPLLEGTLGEGTTVALTLGLGTSKVLPEERVVDVSCGREGEER